MDELTPEDRVRAHSPERANVQIDRMMAASVRRHATSNDAITRRLKELEAEWDVERVLEANAATLGLAGVLLSAFVDRRWSWLPGVVTAFLLQHALQGWCPPVPIFRRLGVRTRREIDAEKYALKALRGDFEEAITDLDVDLAVRARKALQAARRIG